MANKDLIQSLEGRAQAVRRKIVQATTAAGSGHPTSSFSETEILVALYFHILRHRPEDPSWEDRDRFILSKGHGAPGLFAVLAEAGYFPADELESLRALGSRLQGHPTPHAPGVEVSTGALGQGLSFSNGLALAGRLKGANWRVYTLMGDGELHEGQVWEAAMTAAKYKLDNLTGMVDYNHISQSGKLSDIKHLVPLAEKWRAFGWHTVEIDGHDLGAIVEALEAARGFEGRPSMIIAHTVKGKGVSFLENAMGWHGKAMDPEQAARALEELG